MSIGIGAARHGGRKCGPGIVALPAAADRGGGGIQWPDDPETTTIHARRKLDPSGRFHVEEVDWIFQRPAPHLRAGAGAQPRRGDHRADGRRRHRALVREYAAGLHHYELGLPRGRIDPETAEVAANREMKEEIGYGAHELQVLKGLALAPAYMAHRTHVVLARDLYPEKLPGDEPEELEVVPWSMDRIAALIDRPDCNDGRTLAALFMAREYLAGRWQPGPDGQA